MKLFGKIKEDYSVIIEFKSSEEFIVWVDSIERGITIIDTIKDAIETGKKTILINLEESDNLYKEYNLLVLNEIECVWLCTEKENEGEEE